MEASLRSAWSEVVSEEQASIWTSKPWWCQPWTIVLTGMLVVLASWLVLHRWWISAPLAMAVLGWWGLFLVLVPAAYRQEMARQGESSGR